MAWRTASKMAIWKLCSIILLYLRLKETNEIQRRTWICV